VLIRARAIVVAVMTHGENGAIVRAMTPADGLQPGYVRGGRSRRLRPVLLPGNIIEADLRSRTDTQLAALTAELVTSRAPLMAEPIAAAAIAWACALTATALPEAQPYPRLHAALDGLLSAIEAAPSARGWATGLVRFELLLLSELGFGLDLTRCVATGAVTDLAFVSPRSACAVGRVAGEPHADRLLRLPAFVRDGSAAAAWPDILDGLALTGFFLARDLLNDRSGGILPARERLVDRLKRLA
jgi:DNA repair protein RecO (recombination protein O)